METWIIEILEKFGYIGILILIAIENIFPPIPSEVILLFGGFMTIKTELTVMGVVWFATLGSVVGAVVLYGIGHLINVDRLEKIVGKYGHYLRLTKDDLNKADAWFAKYGVWTVFFCRFIPLIRSLISIPAGMANMNFGLFLLLTAVGTFIWNIVLVNLGAAVGESWEDIVKIMDVYSNIIYIVLVVLVIILAILFMKKRLSRK
ncbi:DedA family protein [Lederbergia wuyishanensis]|uniref:Membrane protein DedA with SNARE-associated domain n=1 Tax=Lederbergia wuyishanensis TaxID=1347903 RepID=A0ABU0D0E4_9BACI|nr:DedA family protein [Lederbergia wuyishanensis]MCJ8006487.1 DedA family protein [Lederbergia wuyishanensis]MDQ0341863.1 membrane protein DedA with SNARE-associated domain [Lederbergia wuyishanensis]